MRVNVFKLFWSVYLLEFIIPLSLLLHYVFGYTFDLLIKIPAIIYFLIVVVYHFKKGIILTPISLLFLVATIFSFTYGIISGNKLDGKFFSHIYFSVIPILGISFGYHFANSYSDILKLFFYRIINIAFLITCFILLIYFYLHFISGLVPYWGFGTDMHLLIPFILLQGKTSQVFVGIIFVILSGKRAILLNIFLEILMYFSKLFKSITFKSAPKFISVVLLFIIGFLGAYNLGAFERFEATFQFDFDNEEAMMYATSGRWQEVTGIIDHHNSNIERWFLGAGFGGRYDWDVPLDNYHELKHYAHFTPFAYIFLFGIPFTVILYSFFLYNIFKGRHYLSNPFMILFVVGVFSSFFGANLLIDIKIWIFYGIVYAIINKNQLQIANVEIK